MGRSRAERRHHHQRMIQRVNTFRWMAPEFYHGDEEQRQKHIKKMAENRKKCSCSVCCNPRSNPWAKDDKLTMQERKIMESERYLE